MYRKRPCLKEWRGRCLLHKNLWSWISPSWEYFLRPLAPKRNDLELDLLSTCSAQKLTEFVILWWWILKNAWFCDKNWISWGYIDKSIFFNFKDMDLIFYSGESRESILCNSNQFKRPSQKGGALHWSENWTFLWKNDFFKKISKGALWGALCILKPRRYQKWKKRPFFDLGPTYHVFKAPLRSSILVTARKNPSFLRWYSQSKLRLQTCSSFPSPPGVPLAEEEASAIFLSS